MKKRRHACNHASLTFLSHTRRPSPSSDYNDEIRTASKAIPATEDFFADFAFLDKESAGLVGGKPDDTTARPLASSITTRAGMHTCRLPALYTL